MDSSYVPSPVAIAIFLLFALVLGGCGYEHVQCGGSVSPKNMVGGDRAILEKVKRDSKSYCLRGNGGCDFQLTKTDRGWSVAAIRLVEHDGKCLYGPGDQKFYIYDEAGSLLRVIGGV